VNDRGADHAERDLLDARHRGVEHRAGRKHARKTDQGRGIAGQHEHVGPRRAVEQRNEDAERDPKNDRKRRQLRRVDQIGNDGDHGRAADKGADGAIDGFRAQHAGQRLAGQIDRGHRPARTLQVQAEGDEHREYGRDIAIHGKYDRPNAASAEPLKAGKRSGARADRERDRPAMTTEAESSRRLHVKRRRNPSWNQHRTAGAGAQRWDRDGGATTGEHGVFSGRTIPGCPAIGPDAWRLPMRPHAVVEREPR